MALNTRGDHQRAVPPRRALQPVVRPIMTRLIALELDHTLRRVIAGDGGTIHDDRLR
jgi:hypothetical protein